MQNMHCLKNCLENGSHKAFSRAVERQGQTFDALKMQKGYSQLRFPRQLCETNLGPKKKKKKSLKPEMLGRSEPFPLREREGISLQATLVTPNAFLGNLVPT